MILSGAERTRRYRENHLYVRVRDAAKAHARHTALKAQVLTYYGNGELACIECGESRIACLSIDHINGGDCEQRLNTNLRSSGAFYSWLVKEDYPDGYPTLCMNCQFIKRDTTVTPV